jgi:hypothetical protein
VSARVRLIPGCFAVAASARRPPSGDMAVCADGFASGDLSKTPKKRHLDDFVRPSFSS